MHVSLFREKLQRRTKAVEETEDGKVDGIPLAYHTKRSKAELSSAFFVRQNKKIIFF